MQPYGGTEAVFKRTSSKALIGCVILSLIMTLLGVAALILISSIEGAPAQTVQVLRGGAAVVTGLSLFYAIGISWLLVRRNNPDTMS